MAPPVRLGRWATYGYAELLWVTNWIGQPNLMPVRRQGAICLPTIGHQVILVTFRCIFGLILDSGGYQLQRNFQFHCCQRFGWSRLLLLDWPLVARHTLHHCRFILVDHRHNFRHSMDHCYMLVVVKLVAAMATMELEEVQCRVPYFKQSPNQAFGWRRSL